MADESGASEESGLTSGTNASSASHFDINLD